MPPLSVAEQIVNVLWIDSSEQAWVRAHGLYDLPRLMHWPGESVVALRHGRERLPLYLSAGNASSQYVLERESRRRWQTAVGQALFRRGTYCRRQWRAIEHFRQRGLETPQVLLCLESHGWPREAALILAEPYGTESLSAVLAAHSGPDHHLARADLFTTLGRSLARLHAAGMEHGALYAPHVAVVRQDRQWRVLWRELGQARLRTSLTLAARARDLGCLWATLPNRLAHAADRQVLEDAYLQAAGLEPRACELETLTAAAAERQLQRRWVWELRECESLPHRTVRPLVTVEAGRVWIDREFRPLLARSHLDTFDALMTTTAGRCLRALPDRENWRLELHDAHHTVRGAYLKKHHVRGVTNWLRAHVGAGPVGSAGRAEARSVARLNRSGIAAMRLIAFGEKLHRDGRLESFVLTEELAGATQLDHFLRRRFPPLSCQATQRDTEKQRLLAEVAEVASQFHRMGYNHRDLYCCHFFIREPQPGQFEVNLIDLQRVEHRRYLRRRWLVKDLAQLGYSAPRDRISCTDRLAFIKHYLGVTRLDPSHKRFIRSILAKQRRMQRALGPHP